MGTSANTVTANLARARAAIKEILTGDANMKPGWTVDGPLICGAIAEGGRNAFSYAELTQFTAGWHQLIAQTKIAGHGFVLSVKTLLFGGAIVAATSGVIFFGTLGAPNAEGSVVFAGGTGTDGHQNPVSASLTLEGAVTRTLSWTLTDPATGDVVLSGDSEPADLSAAKGMGLQGRYHFTWHIIATNGSTITVERDLDFS